MRYRQCKRSTRGRSVALALTAIVLAAPPAAVAADPWPSDGNSQFNLRENGQGPSSSRAAQLTKLWQVDLNGAVTGTPVLAENGGVYVGTTTGTAYAVTRDGRIFWARFLGGPIAGSLLVATPSDGQQSVYAVTSSDRNLGGPTLSRLDPLTGAVRWTKVIAAGKDLEVWGSPNFSAKHNHVYIATCSCSAAQQRRRVSTRGAVAALDATTGEVVWDQSTTSEGGNGGHVRSGPAVYDPLDRVYVATDHAFTSVSTTSLRGDAGTDALLSFDAATGERRGGFQAKSDDVAHNDSLDPTKRVGFSAAPNLLASGGRVMVGAGAKNGTYYAVDASTMELVWKQDIGPGSPDGGIRWGSAWDGKRVVGAASLPSQVFGIASAGVLSWRFPGADPVEYGPVSVSRGVAWSADSAGFVNTHEATSGRLLGRQHLGQGSTGGVSFASGRAFVAVGTTEAPGTGGVAAFK